MSVFLSLYFHTEMWNFWKIFGPWASLHGFSFRDGWSLGNSWNIWIYYLLIETKLYSLFKYENNTKCLWKTACCLFLWVMRNIGSVRSGVSLHFEMNKWASFPVDSWKKSATENKILKNSSFPDRKDYFCRAQRQYLSRDLVL